MNGGICQNEFDDYSCKDYTTKGMQSQIGRNKNTSITLKLSLDNMANLSTIFCGGVKCRDTEELSFPGM